MSKKITESLKKTREASRFLLTLSESEVNDVLLDLSESTLENSDFILQENKKDLDRMDSDDPKYDRLLLSSERLQDIAESIKDVVSLEYPVGEVLEEKFVKNCEVLSESKIQRDSSASVGMTEALHLQKVRVPLGVVGVVYEARPNVTPDVFTLCFKSGNATILKGSDDAKLSNIAFVQVIQKVLEKHNLPREIVTLLPSDRGSVKYLLEAGDFVDVLIPRGGQGLIDFVRKNSIVPVIETGAGVCHTYFDEFGNLEYGKNIVVNAKTRRPSVCNSLDCLLIDEKRLEDLHNIIKDLEGFGVEIFADKKAFAVLDGKYSSKLLLEASEDSFGKEFLSLKMSIKSVSGIEEAIEHITKYSSMHSESIVSENKENQELFLKMVDAVVVYVNTSTAFTDGGQFGLGAEIGISTQKLHARGPMSLKELTSYKWLVRSQGMVRDN